MISPPLHASSTFGFDRAFHLKRGLPSFQAVRGQAARKLLCGRVDDVHAVLTALLGDASLVAFGRSLLQCHAASMWYVSSSAPQTSLEGGNHKLFFLLSAGPGAGPRPPNGFQTADPVDSNSREAAAGTIQRWSVTFLDPHSGRSILVLC